MKIKRQEVKTTRNWLVSRARKQKISFMFFKNNKKQTKKSYIHDQRQRDNKVPQQKISFIKMQKRIFLTIVALFLKN